MTERPSKPDNALKRMRGYLEERGFPIDSNLNTYQRSMVLFGGPAECREAINLPPDNTDTRTGIIFQFPDSNYTHVRWFGKHKRIDIKAQSPAKAPAQAYITPVCNWENYTEDETLYVCESPLKALVLAWRGYYAIAGTGVWNLAPQNVLVNNFPLHLGEATSKVVILFDNDFKRNPHVRAAVRRIGEKLSKVWPHVDVVNRPLTDPPIGTRFHDVSLGRNAGKWGIDDAISELGDEWLESWLQDDQGEEPIEPTPLQLMMDDMSLKYCVVASPSVILKMQDGNLLNKTEFVGIVEADKRIWVPNQSNDNGRFISVAEEWLKDSSRTYAEAIVYRPGGREGYDREASVYNRWRDSGVQSVEGDVEPFLKVYENAVPDAMVRELFFQSCAYMVQNRDSRMEKTFILAGGRVGTGKSLFTNILCKIFGDANSIIMGAEELQGDFNSMFAGKEIIVLDDVHRISKREGAKLRRLVTSETLLVNEKGIRQYEMDNTGIYFITTNEYDAVSMPTEERRNLVVHFEPTTHYQQGHVWWENLFNWLEQDDGYGKIRHWLENMDLTGFNPRYMPPMTEAKRHMAQSSMSEFELFASSLHDDPEAVLPSTVSRSVFTATELYIICTGEAPEGRNDTNRLSKALSKHFFQAHGGRLVRVDGQAQRWWVVRNTDKVWGPDEVREDVGNGVLQLGNKNPTTAKF